MTLDIVLDYVTEILAPTSDNSLQFNYIRSFLTQLRSSGSVFSQRLLVCIGIDLRVYEKEFPGSGELQKLIDSYRQIILLTDNIDVPKTFSRGPTEPHVLFALAQEKHGKSNCKPHIEGTGSAAYVRVMNFNSYFNFVLPKNKALNPDVPQDVNPSLDVRNQFYEEFTIFKEHRTINISSLSSGTGWVFATDKDELQTSLKGQKVDDVLDRIGYYAGPLPAEPSERQYVYLEYPGDFGEPMLQPTALIGDWGRVDPLGQLVQGNEYFLSYKRQHQWGKTFPVTGSPHGVKERAHQQFSYSGKSYAFAVGDLAELTKALPQTTAAIIIQEALHRFKNA